MNFINPFQPNESSLSQSETTRLQYLESLVVSSIHNLGEALFNIKEERLYREYGTWEQYCMSRFDITKRSVDRAISAYVESSDLKSSFMLDGYDQYEDTIDTMSQQQLLASKRSELPMAEKIGAVIASVDDEGHLDGRRFYEELNHRSNPQGIRERSIVGVRESDDVIEEFHGRSGEVLKVAGNVCKVRLHAVNDGNGMPKKEETLSFVFSELSLISHPEPGEVEQPKPRPKSVKKSPLEVWRDDAIALFNRIYLEVGEHLPTETVQSIKKMIGDDNG